MRQIIVLCTLLRRDPVVPRHPQLQMLQILHRFHTVQTLAIPPRDICLRCTRRHTTTPAPHLARLGNHRPVPLHCRVPHALRRKRLRQNVARERGIFRREIVECLGLALQFKAAVGNAPSAHQLSLLSMRIVRDDRITERRELPDQRRCQLRSFNRGAWNPHPVSKESQRACHRAPAAADARLADARRFTPRCRFVDHQIERHHLRQQICEPHARCFGGFRQNLWQRRIQ